MASVLLRLNDLTQHHRRILIAIWSAAVIVSVPFALQQSRHLTSGDYRAQGSQSTDVATILKHDFPDVSRTTLAVLIVPGTGATSEGMEANIERVRHVTLGVHGVELTKQARELALFTAGLVGPIVMPLRVTATEDRARDIAKSLANRLGIEKSGANHVEMFLLGQGALWAGVEETSKHQLASAEKIGFPVLLIVLLVIFGSLSAAALPVMLGGVAVVITGALIYFLSLTTELSIFVTNTASMLGIGVAVDYSLIILARVRQELQAGRDLDEARGIALRTSGRAVAFSGFTVIASLFGLWMIPVGTLRSMALGAIIVVAVSVLVSVTLLPALMMVFGARRLSSRTLLRWNARESSKRRVTWAAWTRVVTRHPLASIAAAGGVLVILCVPALSMKTSTGALDQLSAKNRTKAGFNEAAKIAGPGALGPIDVVVHATGVRSRVAITHAIERLRQMVTNYPHVKKVGPPEYGTTLSYGLFSIIPAVNPESSDAKSLVERLRSQLPRAVAGTGVTGVSVGGTSATQLDEQQVVADNMWKVFVAVLTLAFIVLMLLLRSLLLPLKAVIMNLLSVGAAYGVLVVVFQWGWLDGVFQYHSLGHLDTLTPPLVLAIIFGLSMDYEVFLLSRIRERWRVTNDTQSAVAEGLQASAGTISAAAFILVCVFAIFISTGMPPVKELGLGAAVAIAIDATLVRLVLVPATMQVLGRWNWWWPKYLQRLVPTSSAAPGRIVPDSTTV